MKINVHMEKAEIEAVLKAHVEANGFNVPDDPLIRISVDKGDAREAETWHAVVCGCERA